MLDQIFLQEIIDDEHEPIYDKNPEDITWLYIPKTNSIESIPPYNLNHETTEIIHLPRSIYNPEDAQTSKYSNRVIIPLIESDKLNIDNIIWQMIKMTAQEKYSISSSLLDLTIKAKTLIEMNNLRLSSIVSKHKLPNMHNIKFIDYCEIPERHFYAVCEPEYLGRIPMKENKVGFYLFNPRGIKLIKFTGNMYDVSLIMES